ncbi:hypothetical protein [Paludibaculum fermentans]|uniref:Lysozyme inhibitor LprI N-terminal domain-containing protein n=1 Tax=Paludibaculum fermentans TaxID=1473598 RepID=A0A7S7NWR0_PALFE|nr:hypothetical protein [Paludibaculum fermentans]QOY91151.1 hypothetical protein IRI77_14745 [Paludibaculum fermentans]
MKRPTSGILMGVLLSSAWFFTMTGLAVALHPERKAAEETAAKPETPAAVVEPRLEHAAPTAEAQAAASPGGSWDIPECKLEGCDAAALATERDQLTAAYGKLDAGLTSEDRAELVRSHSEWKDELAACTDKDCVSKLYRKRLDLINAREAPEAPKQ